MTIITYDYLLEIMILHIVPSYAAALALLFILLSANVIRGRGQHKVALGSGGMPNLERRVRVHANFAEYVPFTLLLGERFFSGEIGRENFI